MTATPFPGVPFQVHACENAQKKPREPGSRNSAAVSAAATG